MVFQSHEILYRDKNNYTVIHMPDTINVVRSRRVEIYERFLTIQVLIYYIFEINEYFILRGFKSII